MHAACREGLECRLGAGHGEECTLNMSCMFLTLDVSKLSGWLNAYAACRESKGGHMMGSEMRARRREAAGATACKQRAGEGSTAE